jgi:hypothetical protein
MRRNQPNASRRSTSLITTGFSLGQAMSIGDPSEFGMKGDSS